MAPFAVTAGRAWSGAPRVPVVTPSVTFRAGRRRWCTAACVRIGVVGVAAGGRSITHRFSTWRSQPVAADRPRWRGGWPRVRLETQG